MILKIHVFIKTNWCRDAEFSNLFNLKSEPHLKIQTPFGKIWSVVH